MAVTWTKEQQQVISLRERNILVSAAAGSGKTAVLVQRILNKITDKENPVDIDRLLIMTFTRAAAGEMRERISAALEKALYEEPENEHLQKQVTLIHGAQITTIDGFCAYVIRNYFHLIGLDPGYRIAEEGELKLLREDVMKELLEDAYAKGEKEYLHFVECYAFGKSDQELGELINSVYDTAMSHPYPEEWLANCIKSYDFDGLESVRKSKWMKFLWKNVKEDVQTAKSLIKQAIEICEKPFGPYLYEEALESDLLLALKAEKLTEAQDYEGMHELFSRHVFARLSTKKPTEPVGDLEKEKVKDLRERGKDLLKDLGSRYFSVNEEELLEIQNCCKGPVKVLAELVQEFGQRFGAKKREKNLLDFTDMEHFALKILMERKEDGSIQMSEAARELSLKYEEVMVDEYQDSNLVQELITSCVSGWAQNRKNVFMVGDVKQSIYGFRLARPELFMEKYSRYTLEESKEQRIDLHKNFRSREQVLLGANFIFSQIMGADLGKITYDEAAALYPGAAFPEGEKKEFLPTEVLLIEKDNEELEVFAESQDARELEALAVAHKIKELVGKEQIVDKETGTYRPVRYGDIVILLRTASGWTESFTEVLGAHQIPVYAASKTGYFSALEVVTVLNYLRVCDNPLQDIPLTGVLRSPMVGCTSQELAVLRTACPDGMIYEGVQEFLNGEWTDPQQVELQKKLDNFLNVLKEMRSLALYTPVHELILKVLDKTGYGNYAKALPNGAQRSANLAMLVEKAREYEKTSYRGLFHFVRYIEHLQKYEVDYGEANISGAGEGSVEIMTIHKSKGLEFPIVILAGMGKQFNFQDLNARLLVHSDYGLGADAIFPEKRMIVPALNKQIIRRQLLEECLGEEIRVLYVALTRAKEKMILTGTIGNLEKRICSLHELRYCKNQVLPFETRLNGKNYWDFVLPALARHRCMDALYEENGLSSGKAQSIYDDPAEFVIQKVTAEILTETEVMEQAAGQMEEAVLKNWDAEKTLDAGIREEIKNRFEFIYPYENRREIPVKVSVSDLKKQSYLEELDKEETVFLYEDAEIEPVVPKFIRGEELPVEGAARGTVYHKVMECLKYDKCDTKEQLKEQLLALEKAGKMTQEEIKCVRLWDLQVFLNSDLGKRMKTAALLGNLFREQPFVISKCAAEIDPSWDPSERVLVQGIIDAYFMEGPDLVLVDYKTDRVGPDEEEKLAERYRIQLEDYGQALEQMTGKKVKEKYIYSFTLKKAILL